MEKLQIKLMNKNAIVPKKSHIGWDLTAISVVKKFGKNSVMYDTGIACCPPLGYYTEIVAKSLIVEGGYILTNGIIDPSYCGTLRICLTKVDDTKPDIKVPFRLAQLIVRRIENIDIIKVQELSEIDRGDGGFGSIN